MSSRGRSAFSRRSNGGHNRVRRSAAETRIARHAYYLAHREQIKLLTRAWKQGNRDKLNEGSRRRYKEGYRLKALAATLEWQKRNRERSRELHRQFRLRHPERDKLYQQTHKTEKLASTREWQLRVRKQMPAWANKAAILAIYKEAARLTRETGIKHQVDHIIPLRGENVQGLHVENNLQILTASQNRRKSNKVLAA